MNAAFLLVTTAWLAGADAAVEPVPAPKPIAVAPAMPIAAPAAGCTGGGCGSSCGGCATCDSCCESEGRLKGFFNRFRHHEDCGCSTCAPAPTCCDTCGSSGPSMFDRVKGLFHRHKECESCGCESGCGGCSGCAGGSSYGTAGSYGTISAPTMQKVEPIPAPKPKDTNPGDKLPKGDKEVRAIPLSAPPVLEVTPAKTESPF